MSVIIRLQGLPWSASAMNIRHFFSGLSIPAGGVHIIGGEGGDAFIAFSSDDDARVAMKKNMCPLNGSPVQLFLSSKSEMQSVIDAARSGKSVPVAGIAGSMTLPMTSMQPSQSQTQTQRQQFPSIPSTFPLDNQNNSNVAGTVPGQQAADFNPQMANQFAKNDWQNFQMYGGRPDGSSPAPNAFQPNQRMQPSQTEARYPDMQGGGDVGAQFAGFQPQGKAFPAESVGQFPEGSSVAALPQSSVSAMGVGGMQQPGGADVAIQDPMRHSQAFMKEQQMRGMAGGVTEPVPGVQSDNPTVMQGVMGAMGRGKSHFPGQMGMAANRDAYSNMTAGRPGMPTEMQMRNPPPGMNVPANRTSLNEGMLNRPNQTGEKGPGEGLEPAMPTNPYRNQYLDDKRNMGPDGRQQWVGDMPTDLNFPSSQKAFDQDVRNDEKAGQLGRDKILGPEGRGFEQFPYRGDMDRGERLDAAMEPVPKHMMQNEEREPGYAGRGIRVGSRFEPEQGRGFYMYPERRGNRFAKDQVPPLDESVPSTRYPPDDDPATVPGESRPPGRFPPMRGRPEVLLDEGLPPDSRRFPPEDQRMPYRDQGFPDQERFSEGERHFSPAGRRFPPGERFPPSERQFLGEEQGPMDDSRRYPPGPEGRRFAPEVGRFPPDDRMDVPRERVRSEEFMGRRAGEPPFPPDEPRFREDDIRHREGGYGRGPRGPEDRFPPDSFREGRPGMRPGFRDFDEGEENQIHPHERRIPPERGLRGEKDERDMRVPPGPLEERRPRVSRWEREPFDNWQEGDEAYMRHGGPRGPAPGNPEFTGMRRADQMEGLMDMDQRAGIDREDVRGGPRMEGRRSAEVDGMRGLGPEERRLGLPPRGPLLEGRGGFEGMRGRGGESMRGRGGMEGMRGRGMEGMRGRGMEGRPPGMEGRRPDLEGRPEPGMEGRAGLPSLLDDSSFDYGPGPAGRGRPMGGPPIEDEYAGEMHDFDSRFPGPGGRGALFDRPPRGRGEFFRGRGGPPPPPFGRGRGMDMDRRFEDAGPDERFDLDVDARNIGGRPDAPPIRPLMGNQPGRLPDYTVKPGSGKGLLGDAPMPEKEPIPGPVPGPMRPDFEDGYRPDPGRRDIDNRMRRSYDRDRDRDHRSSDRRGREREDRRSGDRDRVRYRNERDRSDRRRSRSRERERGRSRDRSSSTKKDDARTESSRSSDHRTRNVHMKNMPTSVSYKDVRRYLHPIDVPYDGLKLINNEQGQRTGDAYIQFRYVEEAARAVRKSGDKMNGHTVQISFCPDADFAKAVDSFVPRKDAPVTSTPTAEKAKVADDNKPHYIVQLKNLPLNITKQDIIQFFKGLTIENNGEAAYIEFDDGGIATGIGFVELKSDMDYKKALTRDGSLMGTVPIRVFPGKKEEADSLKEKQQEMFQRAALRSVNAGRGLNVSSQAQSVRPSAGPRPQQTAAQAPQAGPAASTTTPATSDNTQQGSDTVCVHIQGLPLLATPKDIREFFSDSQIAQRGINIAHDSRGKPLGEGFVEFKSKADFDKAIKRDKTSLGRHIVAVKPIGRKEMNSRLDNARQQGYPPQQPDNRQSGSDQSKSQKPSDPPPARDRSTGPPASQGPHQGAQNGQGNKPGPKPLLSGPPGPPHSGPAPPHSGVVTPGSSKMIPPGVLNKSWFYVRCQNFPPDISIAEIMGFFQGFRPLGDSIRLHYSSEGKPTGNAVVGFSTPDEAQSALQRLNMKMCRQNVVSLHPA